MSGQVTHFQLVRGLGAMTACGRSMHGWVMRGRVENATERTRDVTCKRCLKALAKMEEERA